MSDKTLEQKFLIEDIKTGELEEFEVTKIFLNDKFDNYGVLLENSNLVLPVTCYSDGSASINGSLGKYYKVPEQTQEGLTKIIQLKKVNYSKAA